QSAEQTRGARVAVLDGFEDCAELLGANADAGVGDMNQQRALVGVFGDDRDLSAVRGELDGVLQEVPEHLLQSRRISADEVMRRVELHLQVKMLAAQIRQADLLNLLQLLMDIDVAEVQQHLPAADAGQ